MASTSRSSTKRWAPGWPPRRSSCPSPNSGRIPADVGSPASPPPRLQAKLVLRGGEGRWTRGRHGQHRGQRSRFHHPIRVGDRRSSRCDPGSGDQGNGAPARTLRRTAYRVRWMVLLGALCRERDRRSRGGIDMVGTPSQILATSTVGHPKWHLARPIRPGPRPRRRPPPGRAFDRGRTRPQRRIRGVSAVAAIASLGRLASPNVESRPIQEWPRSVPLRMRALEGAPQAASELRLATICPTATSRRTLATEGAHDILGHRKSFRNSLLPNNEKLPASRYSLRVGSPGKTEPRTHVRSRLSGHARLVGCRPRQAALKRTFLMPAMGQDIAFLSAALRRGITITAILRS